MNDRFSNRDYIQYISLAMLLILVLFTYSNRVDDLDFWWHLRSGQTTLQDFSIPENDAFSYTTGKSVLLTDRQLEEAGINKRPSSFPYWDVNLRHSWLGQVLFYLIYTGAGFPGIGLFKALVFILSYLVLFWAMRRKGAGGLSALLTLFLIIVIGQDFDYSRPQIFTFFFLSVLIALFVDFKKDGRKIMILPGCFFIWQNLHGGFVIGTILLLIFWFSETGKYLLHRKFNIFNKIVSDRSSIKLLSYTSIISFVITLTNPNHYKVYLVPFAIKKSLFSVIEEYARPMIYEYHAYWLMLVLVLILFVVLIRIIDVSDVLLLSFLLITSIVGIRGIVLFAFGAGPFMAASLTCCWQWLRHRRFLEKFFNNEVFKRLAFYQPLHVLFLMFLLYFGVYSSQAQGFLNFNVSDDLYPGKAVNFLKDKNYPGRLLNPYNWGGYLIWQYPERQTFIDGRCLDETIFFHHQIIMNALGGKTTLSTKSINLPLWKGLLDEYQVQVVLTNAITSTGQIVPLVDKLSIDPDWALVYQDGTALVFLRDTPDNRRLYGQNFLAKIPKIQDQIVSECQEGLIRNPATWNYYKLLGSIYLIRQDLGKSREMFEKYLSINPNDSRVIHDLNLIRSFLGETPLKNENKPKPYHNW